MTMTLVTLGLEIRFHLPTGFLVPYAVDIIQMR